MVLCVLRPSWEKGKDEGKVDRGWAVKHLTLSDAILRTSTFILLIMENHLRFSSSRQELSQIGVEKALWQMWKVRVGSRARGGR